MEVRPMAVPDTGARSPDSPRQLEAVSRIAHLLNSPLPLDDLLWELVTVAAQVAEAEAASLFRLVGSVGAVALMLPLPPAPIVGRPQQSAPLEALANEQADLVLGVSQLALGKRGQGLRLLVIENDVDPHSHRALLSSLLLPSSYHSQLDTSGHKRTRFQDS